MNTQRPEHLSNTLHSLPLPNEPQPNGRRSLMADSSFLNLTPRTLADDCRAKCSGCRGQAATYCPLCMGTGWVCPVCRGMQWLRTGKVEAGGVYGIVRCEACREPVTRMGAIKRYVTNWQGARQ